MRDPNHAIDEELAAALRELRAAADQRRRLPRDSKAYDVAYQREWTQIRRIRELVTTLRLQRA